VNKLKLPTGKQFLNGGLVLHTINGYTLIPYSLNRVNDFYRSLGHSKLWYPYYMGNAVIDSIARAKDHLERRIDECKKGTRLPWMITDENDQIAGMISLMNISSFHNHATISRIAVSPDFQKKGIASAAVYAVMKWAFEEAGFHRLEADVSMKNHASRRCFEKLGFVREGVRKEDMWCADGWHDMAIYGMTEGMFTG
jgi:RimJ/RimL family protein N-acetyltransferase